MCYEELRSKRSKNKAFRLALVARQVGSCTQPVGTFSMLGTGSIANFAAAFYFKAPDREAE
jgi:hypothetical protein